MCMPYYSYMRINPSSQLILDGKCLSGCEYASYIDFVYKVYSSVDQINWNYSPDYMNHVKGEKTSELTVLKTLFANYSSIVYWKVEFTLWIENNKNLTTVSTLLFKVNSLPIPGSCSIEPSNGTALKTFFLINCINWADSDGKIANYEFFGKII